MSARKELAAKSAELTQAQGEANALRARLAEAERAVRELGSATRAEAELRQQLLEAQATSSAAQRARIAELEAAVASAGAGAGEARPEPVGLRRIRGIGPAFERGLLGLGITTVAQIAALGPEELSQLAARLKVRPERLLRDDWVGQAQRLLNGDERPDNSADPRPS